MSKTVPIFAKPYILVLVVALLAILAWVTFECGSVLTREHISHDEISHCIEPASHVQSVVPQRVADAISLLAAALLVVLGVALTFGLLVHVRVGGGDRGCTDGDAVALLRDPFKRALQRGRIQAQIYNRVALKTSAIVF